MSTSNYIPEIKKKSSNYFKIKFKIFLKALMADCQHRKGSKWLASKHCKDDMESKIDGKSKKIYLKYLNKDVSLMMLACLAILSLFNYAYISSSLLKQESIRDGFLRRKILSVDSPITSEWDKLSRRDKIRILDSNFDFQGKIMKYNSLNNLYPQLIKTLTFDQLNSVLSKVNLVIGKKVENHTDFYVDRRFLHEDAKLIRFEFQYGHEFAQTYDDPYEYEEKRTAGKTFKEFY